MIRIVTAIFLLLMPVSASADHVWAYGQDLNRNGIWDDVDVFINADPDIETQQQRDAVTQYALAMKNAIIYGSKNRTAAVDAEPMLDRATACLFQYFDNASQKIRALETVIVSNHDRLLAYIDFSRHLTLAGGNLFC